MNRIKEILDEYKFQIIGGLLGMMVIMLIGLVVLGRSNHQSNQSSQNLNSSNRSFRSGKMSHIDSSKSHQTFVDVEGAVKHPGVYQFTENMRIDDAINLAGGLNRSADRKHVNLAKKLSDQQTVYIPVKGEIKTAPGQSSGSGSSNSGSGGKININQADVGKLQSIDGIGEKRAQKILDYRKSHGNFSKIDDLKNIPGIGDKFLANIKSKATV